MDTPPEVLNATVRHLLEQAGTPVSEIFKLQNVRSSPRSVVQRLKLGGRWREHDRLIVKQAVGDGSAERFGRELVALRLLTALDIQPPVSSKLLAWDITAQLFLLEDLGDSGLATALMGNERAAAHVALVEYAAALGRLHAGTVGHESRATVLRQELGVTSTGLGNPRNYLRDGSNFKKLCEAVGVAVDVAFDDNVQQVEALLATPGPFRTLTHGDPCPDNERRTAEGVVFFDFEASGFDHALLDGSYLMMAFPTCWCVGNLPPEVLAEGHAVYLQTLTTGVPEAAVEATFVRHLLHASARWLLAGDTLVPRAQRGGSSPFMALLAADWQWGPSTARQRLLYRLQAFMQLAQKVGDLRGLDMTATRLHGALVSRWPTDLHRLGDFPAFGRK